MNFSSVALQTNNFCKEKQVARSGCHLLRKDEKKKKKLVCLLVFSVNQWTSGDYIRAENKL